MGSFISFKVGSFISFKGSLIFLLAFIFRIDTRPPFLLFYYNG